MRRLLVDSGYALVDYSDVKSCVDFVARGDRSLVIWVLHNVDSATAESARELEHIAALLNAVPLIVGCRTKRSPLAPGVLYRRHGIAVMSPETLGMFLRGELPFVEEFKGRRFVYLDPDRLRAARERLGLSMYALAQLVGVTKDSIYRYERGYPATESTARKLADVLGNDVLRPVELSTPENEHAKRVLPLAHAPWDLLLSVRASVALSRVRGVVARKIEVLQRGVGVVHDYYAVLAPADDVSRVSRVPVVTERELREERPEEIVKKVRDEFEDLQG